MKKTVLYSMKATLTFLLLLFSVIAFAQKDNKLNQPVDSTRVKPVDSVKKKPEIEYIMIGPYKFKKRNNWACLGVGPNFVPDVSFVNANINADFNFHHPDVFNYVFQVGYTNNSFNYILQENTVSYLQTLNFGIGKFIERRYWKIAGFVGPSLHYTKYYVFDEQKTLSDKATFGVGLHVEPQFILKPAYDFGICMNPFLDVNTTQTVFGLSFGIYFSNALAKKIY